MKFLGKLRIRNQILLSMLIVSAASIGLLGNLVYYLSKNTIENNYKNACTYNLRVSSEIMDIQLDNIVDLTRSVLQNTSFQQAMLSEVNKEGNIEFSGQNLPALKHILNNLLSQDVYIEGISVVNEKGNCMFGAAQNNYNSQYYEYYRNNNILTEEFMKQADEAKGREVFFGYNVLGSSGEREGISFVKKLLRPGDYQAMGYMIVNIRKKLLDRSFGQELDGYQTNHYLILDKESKNPGIYYSGEESLMEETIVEWMEEGESDKFIFSSYVNGTTGWEAVYVIEKEELAKESAYIGGISLAAGVVLVLFSYYVSSMIATRISRPLKTLEKSIQAVGEGQRHIEEVFDDSEIGKIGLKFKEMVNNNLELQERLLSSEINEREAQLLYLQAQINPHFLYNTLDSVYCKAVINEDEEVAEMVLALSNMFKLSINHGKRFISIKDELQRIKEYMYIQDMRYRRFQYIEEVDAEMLQEEIITFVLQPFIENAVHHGLEPKLGNGMVKLGGWMKDNILYFTIEDDGVGMKDLSSVEGGYGICNVRERIRLFYGEEYGVSFESIPYKKTTVTIRLPVMKK